MAIFATITNAADIINMDCLPMPSLRQSLNAPYSNSTTVKVAADKIMFVMPSCLTCKFRTAIGQIDHSLLRPPTLNEAIYESHCHIMLR
jgi:hypothetical protein